MIMNETEQEITQNVLRSLKETLDEYQRNPLSEDSIIRRLNRAAMEALRSQIEELEEELREYEERVEREEDE